MNDSMEEEIYALEKEKDEMWLKVEIMTRTKFFCHETPPLIRTYFSNEANEVIDELQDLIRRINNLSNIHLESRMMRELGIEKVCHRKSTFGKLNCLTCVSVSFLSAFAGSRNLLF